jgi:hypothetical protein
MEKDSFSVWLGNKLLFVAAVILTSFIIFLQIAGSTFELQTKLVLSVLAIVIYRILVLLNQANHFVIINFDLIKSALLHFKITEQKLSIGNLYKIFVGSMEQRALYNSKEFHYEHV